MKINPGTKKQSIYRRRRAQRRVEWVSLHTYKTLSPYLIMSQVKLRSRTVSFISVLVWLRTHLRI
jgi:hypothetical protein